MGDRPSREGRWAADLQHRVQAWDGPELAKGEKTLAELDIQPSVIREGDAPGGGEGEDGGERQ